MSGVNGFCDPRFEAVRSVLERNLENGNDLGASVSIIYKGDVVADMWGGWSDAEQSTPWGPDTITNVWSITKTMTALTTLLLVDRGRIDLDAPVADYWPEFGVNGKENVLVRHLLSHTSGVSGWDNPIGWESVFDFEEATARLARMTPWWKPGTASGYHAQNFGHLIGEIVRRVTGRSLGTYFREELAAPLGADFHIGTDESHFHRISNVVPPPPIPFDRSDPNSVASKTFTSPDADASLSWTKEWRKAEIGAANGHGNARSIALLQSIVSQRGVTRGQRFIREETLERIFQPQSDGTDLVIGLPLSFGLGYALPKPSTVPYVPLGNKAFWYGWGGAFALVDADEQVTLAYAMNKMLPGIMGCPRDEQLANALYFSLERLS